MVVNGTVVAVLGVSIGVVAMQLDRVVCGTTATWKNKTSVKSSVIHVTHKACQLQSSFHTTSVLQLSPHCLNSINHTKLNSSCVVEYFKKQTNSVITTRNIPRK